MSNGIISGIKLSTICMIYFPGIESESKGFSLNWLHKIQHRITGSRDAPKETIKSDKAGRYFGINS